LDQIVSNAGFARQTGVRETRRSDLAHSVEVIAGAFLDLLRHGAPHLERSPGASVVAVSSFVAHRFEGERPFTPSAAAKAALEALVRTAAAELGPQGVTVNAVAPGYTRKDHDRGSALDPAAWAEAARHDPASPPGRARRYRRRHRLPARARRALRHRPGDRG
jgi:NAD(P)-dependent dehydrogenase (short-subunit alcohol dehydrogenase family)